jgi:hypothetical protein
MPAALEEFEPHLRGTVGEHVGVWHRFKKPTREKRGGQDVVYLTTRCGKKIYDHWNVRPTYNPRGVSHCAQCFPNGVLSDGRSKPSKRDANAAGEGPAAGGERVQSESGVPLTSAAEPLVSEDPDGGDGGPTHSESGRLLGTGHERHVDELQAGGETGDSGVAGSPGEEAGQDQPSREHGEGSTKQPARAKRGTKTGTN